MLKSTLPISTGHRKYPALNSLPISADRQGKRERARVPRCRNLTYTGTDVKSGDTGTQSTKEDDVADKARKNIGRMDITGYVERVNYHFERLGVDSRPPYEAFVEAWNNQMPARKMAETFKRRLSRDSNHDH